MARPSTRTITISAIPSKDTYKLVNPYKFSLEEEEYVIDSDYTYSGKTIPPSLWGILEISKWDPKLIRGMLILDYLSTLPNYFDMIKQVTDFLYQVLSEDGVDHQTADLMCEAVTAYHGLWK